MNAEGLLKVYEQISEAPDAVARLRRFVLDLAVRGKLVEQDAGDEPVSCLIEEISEEKAKKTKSAGIAKIPSIESVTEKDKFDLPTTWQWVSAVFPAVGISDKGKKVKTKDVLPEGSFPVVDQGKVLVRGFCNDPEKVIRVRDPLLIFGDHTRETKLIDFDFVVGADGVKILQPICIDPRFYHLALTWLPLDSRGYGRHFKILKSLSIPLPPLAEQDRIVSKVDELMGLCDRLEAARVAREEVRDKLTAASLARLTAPDAGSTDTPDQTTGASGVTGATPTAIAFQTHARFALDTLPALTSRPDQIKTLRHTILNLAVRGKLVEQDPADEPASELLKRDFVIPEGHNRRRKIIKEAAVDASKGLLSSLPSSWEYARVQDLYDAKILIDYADGNHGSLYPRKAEFADEGIPFVSAKDLVNGRVVWEGCSKLNQKRAAQLTKGWAKTGDVLLTHNATVGRVARVPENVEPFLLGTSVTFYRLNCNAVSPDYFYVMLQSPVWQGQLEAIMEQTTRNQVSIQKQAFFKVPVPPLAEQHRIVAKVDALMALCDRLEAALTTADTTRTRLLNALLHEALTPATPIPEAAE